MTCPSDETLVLFADAPREADDSGIPAHLEACQGCAERVDGLRSSIADWRASDLVDSGDYNDRYFERLALEVEQGLDLLDSEPSADIVAGPTAWWQRPPGLVAVLAAGLLLAVSLLGGPEEESVAPEVPFAAAETDSLEEMARELGRSLLDSAADDGAQDDEEAATFLASLSLSQHEIIDELSPIPLTTTLADEFDLLDNDEMNSLITRL